MFGVFRKSGSTSGNGGVMNEKLAVTISWITRNLSQIARFVLAAILLVAVTTVFIDVGKDLLTKEIDSIIVTPVSITEIETVLPAATNACVKGCVGKSKEQIIKKKIETGSATQQVWAYGLQLAAWVGMLGISLWAILALVRFE